MTALYVSDISRQSQIAELLERRKAQGLDFRDEVWEGVLHMSPSPHAQHGRCQVWIARVLDTLAQRHGLGWVSSNANIREPGSGASNYRIPDLLLLPPGARDVDGWIEDGALLAVEILSPREEVVAKLDFYAARGLAEVLYVDWREKRFEVFRREGKSFMIVSADRDGFIEVRAAALRIRRVEAGGEARLEVEDARGDGELPGFGG